MTTGDGFGFGVEYVGFSLGCSLGVLCLGSCEEGLQRFGRVSPVRQRGTFFWKDAVDGLCEALPAEARFQL